MADVKVGDKVSFNGGRRGKQEGVVASIKHPSVRMTAKLRNLERLGVNIPLSRPPVATVATADGKIWTVPVRLATVIGKGDYREAHQKVAKLKQEIRDSKEERKSKAIDEAHTKGLFNLNRGDKVTVHYREGNKVETFVGFSASHKIGILNHFSARGVRYIDPRHIVSKV